MSRPSVGVPAQTLALKRWRSERLEELDELFSAHAKVGGTKPGRRYRTRMLNQACIVALSGQFQGFARELVEEGLAGILDAVAPTGDTTNNRARFIIQVAVTRRLSLDRKNPERGTLTDDFRRLGLDLTNAGSNRALWKHRVTLEETWTQMERLNTWRNAIAHHDFNFNEKQLKRLAGVASPNLKEVRACYRACDRLAGYLDAWVRDVWADLAAPPP